MAFRLTYVWFLLDLWHHLYIFSYYHSFKGISTLANYMAKLLWEWKPRFAVALVVRDLLIVTSHTNCDVTSGPVVMHRYVEKCMDTGSISWTYKKILVQRCQPLLILLNHYSFWRPKSPFLLNISIENGGNSAKILQILYHFIIY